MSDKKIESLVKSCYSNWSQSYYDDYYGEKAGYPPIHSDIIKDILLKANVRNVLDAGCGPASFLRDLVDTPIDLFGFDLTPEMVMEAKEVLLEKGRSPDQIWEGSVLDSQSFQPPGVRRKRYFDATICIGVFPHIPEDSDIQVLQNLKSVIRKNGLAIVGARNQLFSLFTLNRYSFGFFMDQLIPVSILKAKARGEKKGLNKAFEDLKRHFRMDLPPIRRGKRGEPGYDEILSRTHNPFILKKQFEEVGFRGVEIKFYHYHCLPPMYAGIFPKIFNKYSLQMENPDDWRGYFMASAFLMVGRTP